jgi:signal transduction histidine kinase
MVAWIDHASGFVLATSIGIVCFTLLVRAMTRTLAAAEASNQAKDRFLTALSHELRTPLTPALLGLGILRKENLSADGVDELRRIEQSIMMEVHLIEDLLHVTAMSSERRTLRAQNTDLHTLVGDALACCNGEIAAKTLEIHTAWDAQQHVINADPWAVTHVFWSILRNSIKFTPEGGQITVRTTNPAPGSIEVTITDNGIGMDASTLQGMFQLFKQGGDGVAQQLGGLGVGMAVAHAIITRHQGSITAASEGVGKGSRFTITLPCQVPA